MSPRRPASRPVGFTLLELVVGMVVSAIVIAGAVALFIGQQRRFNASSSERGLQETARTAIGEIASSLRMAGFGVDPGLAFDFGFADNIMMSQAPAIGVSVRVPGYACAGGAVACRDSTTGPDEIVFYARDPAFGHVVQSVTGTSSITLVGPLDTPLYKGQVLQVMCMSGTELNLGGQQGMLWAYVTVGQYVAPNTAAATVTVPLLAPTGNALDFPTQNATLANACFSSIVAGAVVATKVDRYHYYVQAFDAKGNALARGLPETAGTSTFLMLDQGTVDQGGNPLLTFVAPDVEDLQFWYIVPAGPVPVIGNTSGTAIAAGPTGIDLAPATNVPGYMTPLTDPSRQNQHPANIRGVQVGLVVRQANADVTVSDTSVPANGNRPAINGLPGYHRLRIETTVPVPNMDARYPYFPLYSTTTGDGLNVGGG